MTRPMEPTARASRKAGQSAARQSQRVRGREHQVRETIRSMIMELELPPGSIVSEGQLMERLGVGRTPVREALLVLAQEYLIRPIPGVGNTVAGLDISDFAAIYHCQQALEPYTAKLAAARISDEQCAELEAILSQAESARVAGDHGLGLRLDLNFHEIIGETSGSSYLADSMMRFHRLGVRFARYAYDRGASITASLMEHQGIVDALARHASDEAERLMREHTEQSWERIRASM